MKELTPHKRTTTKLAAWLTLVVSLSVTLVITYYAKKETERTARENFDYAVNEFTFAIRERMSAYENLLRSGMALFAADLDSSGVTRAEWQAYVNNLKLDQNYPGVLGIGFVKYIPSSNKDAHIRQIQNDGIPDYTIWPEGNRPDYTSIIYIEPQSQRNKERVGYDMFTEPALQAIMERAKDTGMISISRKVRLVQETDKNVQVDFIMYLPVYHVGKPTDTVEERRAALDGYIFSLFRINDLMNGVLGVEKPLIDIEIFDGKEILNENLMYDSDSIKRFLEKKYNPALAATATLDISGHTWSIFFSAIPSFEERLKKNDHFYALIGGTIISLLLFTVAVSLANTNTKAAELATNMTKELRESETRFRVLFEQAAVGVAEIEAATGRFNRINKRYCEIVGYSEEEMKSTTFQKITHPDDLQENLDNMKLLVSRKIREFSMEKRYFRKDGGIVWVNLSVSPMWAQGEDPRYHIAVVQDITERKKAEEALRASEHRFYTLLQASPVGVFYEDGEGNCTYVNDKWCKISGLEAEEALGKGWVKALHPDEREAAVSGWEQVAREGVFYEREGRYLRPDGRVVYVYVQAVPLKDAEGKLNGYVATVTDITGRKNMEAENLYLQARMLHGQKLESLGILAGGIAHDFNNLLMSIMGNTEMALINLQDGSPARESMEKVREVVHRASELTKQMLAYSGKGKFVVENIDLSNLVEDMAELLKVSITKNITIRCDLAHNLPRVEADATQIRQVLMNLMINASDSIGDKPGVITVTTGTMECDRKYLSDAEIGKELPEMTCVYIDVTDNGCGMDEETKARIFDPFFTTKFTGRGLGLAAVLGIIRGHKGALKVYSRPGEGTTFRVLLPKSDKHIETRPEVSIKVEDWKGSGTILLVDDEEDILSVTKMILEGKGFKVLTAPDGLRGIELFREHANEITAALLDMTMPNMNGEAAFREMKKIRSDVKAILTSGYNEEEVTSRFNGEGFAGFIQKPYALSDLINKLQKILG